MLTIARKHRESMLYCAESVDIDWKLKVEV